MYEDPGWKWEAALQLCRESWRSNTHSHISVPHPDLHGDETICFSSSCLDFPAVMVDNLELWVKRNPFCPSCFLLGYFVSATEKKIDTAAKEVGSWPYGFYIFWLFCESIWCIWLEKLLNDGSKAYGYSSGIMEISMQRRMQKWSPRSFSFREEQELYWSHLNWHWMKGRRWTTDLQVSTLLG